MNDLTPRPRIGRPRAVTLAAVVDAACAMDLQDLNMSALAERLRVGVATIYRHFPSREDLVKLVSLRKARQPLPVDTGQDWTDLARAYAEMTYLSLSADPQILVRFLEGGFGPDFECHTVESFLAAMARRGFREPESLRLLRMIRLHAAGAALLAAHVRALRATGQTFERSATIAIESRAPEELPHLRRVADAYAQASKMVDWRDGVEAMLRGFAQELQPVSADNPPDMVSKPRVRKSRS